LNFYSCKLISNKSLERISQQESVINGLQTLSLAACNKLTAGSLGLLVSKFTHLKEIDLSFNVIVSTGIVRQIAKAIGENLEKIGLAFCKQVRDTAIKFMASICRNLKYIDLSATDISFNAICSLQGQEWESKLETLVLSQCTLTGSIPSTESKTYRGFPKLHNLILSKSSVHEKGLAFIASKSDSLSVLNLTGCTGITGSIFVEKQWPQLYALYVSSTHCKSQRLLEMALCCTSLEQLDLFGSLISEDDLAKVLVKCTSLHTLNIGSCRSVGRNLRSLSVPQLRQHFTK